MRHGWPVRGVVGVCLAIAGSSSVAAQSRVDHRAFNLLLRTYVTSGLVDYRGFQAQRMELVGYLTSLEPVDPARFASREEQLAFWINAYNAFVIKAILDRYPLRSVKQIGGFFGGLRQPIAGRQLSLDDMEERARALGDWRMHIAVVCASSSCPPLRAEAYVPERLNEQLNEQVRTFLRDPQRGLRVEGNTLWVSKIFDWYAADVVPPKQLGALRRLTAAKLVPVLIPHLAPEVAQSLQGRKLSLKFLPYDWALNDQVDTRRTR